ncbi:MAG: GNAT family N-acetyltransferase [Nitrososphaerales archaeon]|jgi:predicted N-acetyltransferase YhbS
MPSSGQSEVTIAPLKREELSEADRILRLAFGTFLGVPEPAKIFADKQIIANRWKMNPSWVLGARLDGELVGSNVLTRWGKFGWFGPLTVRPDLWDRGIAGKLMGPTMELFSSWKTTHEGLMTFANSPKHLGLYQKFGFHTRSLTAIMEKKVEAPSKKHRRVSVETFSGLSGDKERGAVLRECREMTDGILAGLDVSEEIKAVQELMLGDTVLVRDGSRVAGFAVCHVGPNTEAGSGTCYIKFGLASGGTGATGVFRGLLAACESFASQKGAEALEAGVNLSRTEAYVGMQAHGFRTEFQGVSMQRPNEPGYNRPGVFAIDDLR